MNVRRDGGDRSGHIAQVGLVVFVQRRGHADDDRVHPRDLRVVGGGAEAGLLRLLNLGGKNAHDVGAAGVEFGHLVRRDVEARYLEAFAAEQQRQRQSDIPHPDDSDAGFAGFDFLLEVGKRDYMFAVVMVTIVKENGVPAGRRSLGRQ